ncbi:MAG: hypothetical protein JXA25_19415 [Anaerolineales bacterium]|nr:hypothetical protein [Anaerolineales bacterium]
MSDKTRPIPPDKRDASDTSTTDTVQRRRQDTTQPLPVKKPANKNRVLLWILLIFLISLTLITLAAFLGAKQGEDLRYTLATAQVGEVALEQFTLGMKDYEEGRYEMAVQRFEYVLELEPNFPGVSEKIDEILVFLNQPTRTSSPTVVTATPTSRTVSLEDLYQGAEEAVARSDWTVAIDTLVTLRGYDLSYRTADVESLLYLSLRSRGLNRIWQGDHEQGIYDLNQAERFGPLDSTAISWRNSAAFYLTANSYLGIDWDQATAFFGQICAGSTWDSCSKYAFACYNYAEVFLKEEDWCSASYWYDQSLRTYLNNDIVPTATRVARQCLTATAPTITLTPTMTLTPEDTLEYFTPTQTSTGSGPAASPTAGTPSPTATTGSPPTATNTLEPTPTFTDTVEATNAPG